MITQRRTQCCSGQAEIRHVGQPEELVAQLHNVVTTFDFNQEQTPATRAAIEGFLEKVGAQLWIQHDLPAVEWVLREGPRRPAQAVQRGGVYVPRPGTRAVEASRFRGSVNVALGLPIVRTSVDHDTAVDIAGKGEAQTVSFVKALEFAARMARL